MIRISVTEFIGPLAITAADGQRLHEVVTKALEAGRKVAVDFTGVSTLTSVFLNTALGQLFGRFPAEVVDASVTLGGLDDPDMELWGLVRERALAFYLDPAVRRALELSEDDDE